ncbi:MOSC domain-containing protein [Actinoplanes sp. ATCC 53533]|uniref:MOSC domain-containing protein n=1 Tax=Actinoplanes sp. ATCC 53533 TaxID=1288362 RepID=UPI0018F34224|nr:MOSC domain-containing protein [Actinoplanes sp. ATCC 53533]
MSVHQQETVPVGQPGQRLSVRGTVAAVSCNDVYSFTKPVRDEIVLIAGLGVAGDVHAGVTVRHRSRVAADPDQPNLRQVHLIRSELHDELSEAGYEVPPGGLGENVTTSGIDLLALPVGTVLRFGPAPAAAGAACSAPGRAAGPSPAGSVTAGSVTAGSVTAGPADGAAAVVAVAAHATLDHSTATAVAALAARLASEQSAGAPTGESRDFRPAIVVTGLRNPCQQINRYRPGLLKRVLVREDDGSVSRRAGVMAVVLRGGPIRPGTEIHVELPGLPHLPLDRV